MVDVLPNRTFQRRPSPHMQTLTFNPIHLIVPTSSSAKGLNSLSNSTVSPVFSPGVKTDLPEKTETLIGSELYAATPTSWDGSEGSPMTGVFPDFGMKRTRPMEMV